MDLRPTSAKLTNSRFSYLARTFISSEVMVSKAMSTNMISVSSGGVRFSSLIYSWIADCIVISLFRTGGVIFFRMTILTFGDILNQVVQKRGPLLQSGSTAHSSRGYQVVWAALNKYISSVLSEGKGLHVNNFCTVCVPRCIPFASILDRVDDHPRTRSQ